MPEQTKHDEKGYGFSGSAGFLHLDRVCFRDPQLHTGSIMAYDPKH